MVIEQTFNISDGSFNLRLNKKKICYLNTLKYLQGQFENKVFLINLFEHAIYLPRSFNEK